MAYVLIWKLSEHKFSFHIC